MPLDIEAEILSLSRRRCCLCFGLLGDFGLKRGQIAHLDHDPSHNDLDDLAYLCLDHHDEYDSTTRQSKGLRLKEVKHYRHALYEAVRQHLPSSTEEVLVQGESHDPLASRGELDFYLSSFAGARDSGRRSLRSISEATRVATAAMDTANDEALTEIRKGTASKAGRSRYYSKLASALTSFAHTLTRETSDLAPTAKRMLEFLSRASAVASDLELATTSIFEDKIRDLDAHRDALLRTARGGEGVRRDVVSLQRGTTEFNRARRLAVAALDSFAEEVRRELVELESHENHLRRALELL